MHLRSPARIAVLIFGAWLVAAALPAYGYLDPASGSMFLQLLLGGLAGAALFFKLVWHRIRDFLRPGSSSEGPQEQTPD